LKEPTDVKFVEEVDLSLTFPMYVSYLKYGALFRNWSAPKAKIRQSLELRARVKVGREVGKKCLR